MVFRHLVDDGFEEERVLEQTLDRLDEQRGEVSHVGEGRGKGVRQGCGCARVCARYGVSAGVCGSMLRCPKGMGVWVLGDIELVQGFESRDLGDQLTGNQIDGD